MFVFAFGCRWVCWVSDCIVKVVSLGCVSMDAMKISMDLLMWAFMAASVLMLFDNEAQKVTEQEDHAGCAVIWRHRSASTAMKYPGKLSIPLVFCTKFCMCKRQHTWCHPTISKPSILSPLKGIFEVGHQVTYLFMTSELRQMWREKSGKRTECWNCYSWSPQA